MIPEALGFITCGSQINQVQARGIFLLPLGWEPQVRHRRDTTMDDEIQEYKLKLTDKTLAKHLETLRQGSWVRQVYERALVKYERERDSKMAYS